MLLLICNECNRNENAVRVLDNDARCSVTKQMIGINDSVIGSRSVYCFVVIALISVFLKVPL